MAEEQTRKVVEVDTQAVSERLGSTPVTPSTDTDGSDVAATPGFIPALRRNEAVAIDTGSGVVDVTGIRPPFLSIVHGVGKLAETFNPGDLVLGGEHLLATKDSALNVIVLKYNQFVKESLTPDQYGAGMYPRVFQNKEAAAAAGLRIEWGPNSEKPEADFALDMMLLIEKPEKIECGMFGIELGGKPYALALASFDKTAYKSVANTFLQSMVFAMRGKKPWAGVWQLKLHMQVNRKNPNNKAWVPGFALKRFLEEKEIAEIESLFGAFLVAKMPEGVQDPPVSR